MRCKSLSRLAHSCATECSGELPVGSYDRLRFLTFELLQKQAAKFYPNFRKRAMKIRSFFRRYSCLSF